MMETNRIREYVSDSARGDGSWPARPASVSQARARWKQTVEKAIANHPVMGIGAGLCLGVLLGWLVKRR
jgi:ElaB/YqjD/DUF883 family membrane-anchored ribosome-binding protein